MKMKPFGRCCAFTLIEMLVVMGIILVLAGMLLPVLSRARLAVKKKNAKVEMAHLVTAISQFSFEYQRMPGSKMALNSLTVSCPDFTFGTVLPDGSQINTNKIYSVGNNSTYQNCNAELMDILCNMDQGPNGGHICNPRKIAFFHPHQAPTTVSAGLGPDGVLRDPWGNPYIITLDLNADGQCQDGFYYPLTKKTKPLFVRDIAMVWSMGPDGAVCSTNRPPQGVAPATWDAAKYKENKDNILSWE